MGGPWIFPKSVSATVMVRSWNLEERETLSCLFIFSSSFILFFSLIFVFWSLERNCQKVLSFLHRFGRSNILNVIPKFSVTKNTSQRCCACVSQERQRMTVSPPCFKV